MLDRSTVDNTNAEQKMTVETKMLEKVRVEAQTILAGQLLNDLELSTMVVDHFPRELLMRLSSYVMAEETDRKVVEASIEVPRNWWEMLKRDHYPAWFVRMFPVRTRLLTKRVRIRKLATYPKLRQVFPKDQNGVVYRTEVTQ